MNNDEVQGKVEAVGACVQGFWAQLPKPFFALAPMADVTDPAFRKLIAEVGKPDVLWTEFVSADGLFMGGGKGFAALSKDLAYAPLERPIIAQFFGSNPERMKQAAELAVSMGFDGIDINMGCPDKSIEKQGCGAAMIKSPEVALAVIAAVKEGAGNVPVSVKTRLGYSQDILEEWLPKLLATRVAAITIHARTRKELSLVPAHWNRIADAVRIRDAWSEAHGIPPHERTLILGNGDVHSLEYGESLAQETGCDGIMVGRAVLGNPWFFARTHVLREFSPFYQSEEYAHKHGGAAPQKQMRELTPELIAERLGTLKRHVYLFETMLPHKNFSIMKKHFKAYVNGWRGAKELRIALMAAATAQEVDEIVMKLS